MIKRLSLAVLYTLSGLLVFTGGCFVVMDNNGEASNYHQTNHTASAMTLTVKQLRHSHWQLDRMPGADNPDIYQKFGLSIEGDKLSAKAFNTFFGQTNIDHRQLRLRSKGGITKMLVRDAVKAQLEKQYFARLTANNYWRTEGQWLILSGSRGELYFKRTK